MAHRMLHIQSNPDSTYSPVLASIASGYHCPIRPSSASSLSHFHYISVLHPTRHIRSPSLSTSRVDYQMAGPRAPETENASRQRRMSNISVFLSLFLRIRPRSLIISRKVPFRLILHLLRFEIRRYYRMVYYVGPINRIYWRHPVLSLSIFFL